MLERLKDSADRIKDRLGALAPVFRYSLMTLSAHPTNSTRS